MSVAAQERAMAVARRAMRLEAERIRQVATTNLRKWLLSCHGRTSIFLLKEILEIKRILRELHCCNASGINALQLIRYPEELRRTAAAVSGELEAGEHLHTLYLNGVVRNECYCPVISDADSSGTVHGIYWLMHILKQRRKSSVRCLYLNNNKCLPAHGRFIGECLRVNPSIHSLSVNNNLLGPEGTKNLVDELLAVVTVGNLQSLCLNNNAIGDQGATELARYLSSQKLRRTYSRDFVNIKKLYISANGIGDMGLVEITEGLKVNDTLLVLGLENNGITDRGIMELCRVLSGENYTLKTIALDGNPEIGKLWFGCLEQLLELNRQFTSIGAWSAVRSRPHIGSNKKAGEKERLPRHVHLRLATTLIMCATRICIVDRKPREEYKYQPILDAKVAAKLLPGALLDVWHTEAKKCVFDEALLKHDEATLMPE